MRKIDKTHPAPDELVGQTAPVSAAAVDETVYKAPAVREQLLKDQYHKCAYCEKFIEGPYDDVEHYRPKSMYYWLAYDWENLLYGCALCNRSLKKTNFPLLDEAQRDLAGHDITREIPLILQPSVDNPADYIEFNEHVARAKCVNGEENPRGKYTIELFKLNDRQPLVEQRKMIWEEYQRALKAKSLAEKALVLGTMETELEILFRKLLATNQTSLDSMLAPESQFSGMLKANVHE